MSVSGLTSTAAGVAPQAAAAAQTVAIPEAPSVPEGGVSLFDGVLMKALIGGGMGAAAGFIMPFGGPVIGGLLGAVAGAGFQLFQNFGAVKKIQNYNAAVLQAKGVTVTSEAEAQKLVAGEVPSEELTTAGMQQVVAGMAQQAGTDPAALAAAQQAGTAGTAGTTGATTGDLSEMSDAEILAAYDAQQGNAPTQSNAKIYMNSDGSYTVHDPDNQTPGMTPTTSNTVGAGLPPMTFTGPAGHAVQGTTFTSGPAAGSTFTGPAPTAPTMPAQAVTGTTPPGVTANGAGAVAARQAIANAQQQIAAVSAQYPHMTPEEQIAVKAHLEHLLDIINRLNEALREEQRKQVRGVA